MDWLRQSQEDIEMEKSDWISIRVRKIKVSKVKVKGQGH